MVEHRAHLQAQQPVTATTKINERQTDLQQSTNGKLIYHNQRTAN
jgi:hypothetical protein